MFTTKNLLILIIRNALISLIFVAISVGIIFFVNNKIERITNTIVLNHKLEAKLKQWTEFSAKLESDTQIIGKNDALISKAFIPLNNISEFTNVLDNLATNNKILQTYHFDTPTAPAESGEFSTSTVSYANTLTTDVSTFSKYLKDFEKLPYFTKIEGFNITSQDANGWTGTSTITLKALLLTQTIQ